MLRQVTSKAVSAAPRHVRIVVLSDHPLRQSMWCQTQFPYPEEGCTFDPALDDTRVPVIAADNDHHFSSLQDLHSNIQVFGWIAASASASAERPSEPR